MALAQVRIGFVGTGNIATSHLKRLAEIPQARVVALCDINAQRVREVAAPLSAAVYTDYAKMFDEAKLDAVYVCVPPHAHGEIEVRAARKGLHLFVEKPVNLHLDKALEARRAIEQAGVLSQVGYGLRYQPASFVRLKRFLEGKTIGSAHVFRWSGLARVPWWQRYDQSGGQLVEQTTHQLDFLRWALGEVEWVSAHYSFKRLLADQPEVTIPDAQAVLLGFRSGASATINTSCALESKGLSGIDVLLKGARVSVKGENLELFPENAYELPPAPTENLSIDEAFVGAVASGQAALLHSPYADALKSLAVTLAANRSAAQGGQRISMAEFMPGF